jgi:AraC-like DNA-binding protein
MSAAVRFHRFSPPGLQDCRSEALLVNLVLRGRGRHRDGLGHVHELAPGTLVQRHPGSRSSVWYDPDSGYAELLWGINAETGSHLIAAGFIRPEPVLTIALDQSVIAEFRALCQRMDMPESEHDSRSMLVDFVDFQRGIYDRARIRHVRGGWDATIRKAQALIDHDLEGRVTLDRIATQLEVSYAGLRAEFKRATGMSPGAYRMRKRMETAQRLLLNQPVSQVAKAMGYGDAAVFSKQFKKRFGLSPHRFQLRPESLWMG